ncbi:MAG: Zinc transporter ZupT [Firmicutes bacterium]|nr:Zinc transporter ZupT [Bacillota bacterium]
MDMQNVWFAFGLTLFAGLATGVGSALAFFTKKTDAKFLSIALGFSAGVMIYVSFVEILPKGQESLVAALGERAGTGWAIVAFFSGMLLIGIIDKLVPSPVNPHTMRKVEELGDNRDRAGLLRMGVLTALAIAIHNFPEGLATFTAAIYDPRLGLSIAIAIAIHNIPEGIAVSIPIYYATGDKKKAFLYSFASGLSEPLGAIVGFLLLGRLFNELTFGVLFAFVAGIMVFVSLDQLLPAAAKYGEHHLSIYGLVTGMAVMAVSLVLVL